MTILTRARSHSRPSWDSKRMLSVWYRHYRLIFFILLFGVLLLGAWYWYQGFYGYRLSEEEKQVYVREQFQETPFQEAQFRTLVKVLDEKAQAHAAPVEPARDIFSGLNR